jgi:hypothetical protein
MRFSLKNFVFLHKEICESYFNIKPKNARNRRKQSKPDRRGRS